MSHDGHGRFGRCIWLSRGKIVASYSHTHADVLSIHGHSNRKGALMVHMHLMMPSIFFVGIFI